MVITGRNEKSLETVKQLDPKRVVPVSVTGSKEAATKLLQEALQGRPADAVLDCAGNAKTPDSLLACLANLKGGGVLALVGSMDVPLPLNTGKPECLM